MNTFPIIKKLLLLTGICILMLLIQKIGITNLIKILKEANIAWIALGIILYTTALLIRSYKWHILFNSQNKKISFLKFTPIFFINSMLSNITPGKSGELVTPFLLKKYFNSPIGKGFSIVIIDRLIETLVLALLIIIGLYSTNISIGDKNNFHNFLIYFTGLLLALLAFLLFILFAHNKSRKIAIKIECGKKFKKIFGHNKFLSSEISKFHHSCKILIRKKKLLMTLIFLSFIAWFFELLSFYSIIRSIFEANFLKIATLQLIAIGITLVSFIPAGLGIGNISFAYLSNINGYQYEQAGAASLLTTLFFLGLIILYGNISIFCLKKSKKL